MDRDLPGLCAALMVLLVIAPGVVPGAKEDVAGTIIRRVERREQAIMKMHSMKAVWECKSLNPPFPGGDKPIKSGKVQIAPWPRKMWQREAFMLEGDKERMDRVSTSPGQPEQRDITVSDGQTARKFRPTGTGLNRGPHSFHFEPGRIVPAMAPWVGIPWRFASAEFRAMPDSARMRRGTAMAERVPGPPERYRITARREDRKGRETWREVQTWWVAPEYGYAAVKWQFEYTSPRRTRHIAEWGDFRELAPGVWLPHRYASGGYVVSASGKWELTDEQQAVAKEMKVNIDIPDHYFRLPEEEAGSKEGLR